MNDEQDSGPKSQIPGSGSPGSPSQSSDTDANQDTGSFDISVNAAEIAGETVSVVGEATDRMVRIVERRKIAEALAAHDGNKTRAAETLGVSYKTLLTKIKDYDL